MKTLRTIAPLVTLVALNACASGVSSPDALAKALQSALSSGNFEAARPLADLAGAPAELQFYYFSNVLDCSSDSKCTTVAAPLDAEFRDAMIDDAKKEGADPSQIEGVIVVTSKGEGSSGTMKVPYAKFGNQYKIATLHPSAAELARRRAQTGESQLKAMFDAGIYDTASNERRTDWATAAKPLPADGGEAGAALLAQSRAMAAAVDAHDPDAAARNGSRWAKIVFADKDYAGKPIALELRKRKLYVQSLRMLRDVKVSGGYQLGDDAALIVEARNGIGWTERGAVLMTRSDGAWDLSGKQTISFPQ